MTIYLVFWLGLAFAILGGVAAFIGAVASLEADTPKTQTVPVAIVGVLLFGMAAGATDWSREQIQIDERAKRKPPKCESDGG